MGNPIQPENLKFTTREYYLDGGDDYAYDQTLSFQQLDTTLIYLSNSIANAGSSFIGLTSASVDLNTIHFTKSDDSKFSITVDTGSGQTYTAGNGILINGSNVVSARLGAGLTFNGALIDADVRTVNGTKPTNGNIPVSLTAVLTGPSASNPPNNLIGSSSGDATGSIANATVWIVSGDTSNPDPDGLAYIFISQSATAGGAGEWLPLSYINQDTADLRYVRKSPDLGASEIQPITSSLNVSGSSVTFSSSLFWSGASNLGGATNYVLVLDDNGQIYKTGSYGAGGGGSGTPSLPFNSIQFNNAGGFGGSANLTFDGTSIVNLTGSLITSGSTPLRVIGTGSVTGSIIISRSIEGTPLTVIGTGSSPILNVIGSTGNLLQAYDKVSGDIFTVGDYPSGLPILRVTSDRETFIGDSNAPGLYNSFITSSLDVGSHDILYFPANLYNAAWIDYVLFNGPADVRTGTVSMAWNDFNSGIACVDTPSSTAGDSGTNYVEFIKSSNATDVILQAVLATNSGWTIKTIIRAI